MIYTQNVYIHCIRYNYGEIIMTKKLSSISNTSDRLLGDNLHHSIQDKKIPHCNQNYCFFGLDLRLKTNHDSFHKNQEDI